MKQYIIATTIGDRLLVEWESDWVSIQDYIKENEVLEFNGHIIMRDQLVSASKCIDEDLCLYQKS
jgi:hypothetical protein